MTAVREATTSTANSSDSDDEINNKIKNNSGSTTCSSSSLLQGYSFVGIGLLLLLGPILSLFSLGDDDDNGDYWRRPYPYLRVLTFLPAALVICICHWVSLRIYLRR